MRNRSLTAIKAITQALLDRRASRVETRNFEILGDWFLNSSRNDHQGITSTKPAEGVAAAAISADSSEPTMGTLTSRMTTRPAGMSTRQWKNYKTRTAHQQRRQ